MRRFLLVLTLLLTGFGCNSNSMDVPALSTLPKPNESSSTTMLIGYGYTGGFGSMPVLNDMGEIQTINNTPVYFDESYQKQVAAKLPDCYAGTPLITVRAEVKVEERHEANTSLPNAPEEKYFVAVVKNLESIEVSTQPCNE